MEEIHEQSQGFEDGGGGDCDGGGNQRTHIRHWVHSIEPESDTEEWYRLFDLHWPKGTPTPTAWVQQPVTTMELMREVAKLLEKTIAALAVKTLKGREHDSDEDQPP